MIKDGHVYECVDARKGVDASMDGIVMIQPVAGGFEVWNFNGRAQRYEFHDDDQLEEVNAVSTFHMPEGQINFVELTLPDFERLGGPEIYNTPKFRDTEHLQRYFRERIENS